jgi:nucleotide-binding universal stress UspA family protein
MYNKILVPLDGSKTAECSLEHVKTIATGCNVPEVLLLFVEEPVPMERYRGPSEDWKTLIVQAKQSLAKIEKDLVADGVGAKTIILEGKPAETIIDYAAKNNIDLIIMSTHGRSGPSRWAFGSVADRVVRSSTVPVLIAVPRGCRFSGY